MKNFVSDCIEDSTKISEIDDYIYIWHEGNSNLPLHEFLDLTWDEYAEFVMDEYSLIDIIDKYKNSR